MVHYELRVVTNDVNVLVCGASNYAWAPDVSEVSHNPAEVVVLPLDCRWHVGKHL